MGYKGLGVKRVKREIFKLKNDFSETLVMTHILSVKRVFFILLGFIT